MHKVLMLATVSAIAFSHAAQAAGPSHVQVAHCSPLIRQELKVMVGHPLVVAFPKGESVWLAPMSGLPNPDGNGPLQSKNIEGVNAADLQKQPIKNFLTLWPDLPGVTTMTVIAQTDDGSLKTYPFTLTAVPDLGPALGDPDVTLNLICQTTAVPRTAQAGPPVVATAQPGAPVTAMHVIPAVRRRVVVSAAEKAEAEERLRTDAFNRPDDQECHYHAKGKQPSALQPMCPMDNGQWTLIRFKGLTHKPAVYIGSCEGGNDDERLARQHGAGDFIVIEEIAAQFCLRLGSNPNDVLEVINDRYDPAGNDPGTGTLSPNVQRETIQAKSH